jgi:transcriptional regulator with XRE-family HTH domain
MPSPRSAGTGVKTGARRAAPRKRTVATSGAVAPVLALARQVKGWADSVLAMAGPATDLALRAAGHAVTDPKARAAIHKGGAMLKRMREAAGLTLQDLAAALNLRDPELLASAEGGKVAIPFELILRIAAVIGRDDPITAAMQLTRSSNPQVWKTLEQLGVGRWVLQAGRERELANIYRASDAARRLDDGDFAAVLGFTRAAFDTAVTFRRPAVARTRR